MDNLTIAEIVVKDFRTAPVFKSFGIDFCCKGNRGLDAVCQKQNINKEALIEKLESVMKLPDKNNIDFKLWDLDLLIDYIEKKHHRFINTKSEEIFPFLEKVVRVHGEKHKELYEIEDEFKKSIENLKSHMFKEENVLFPYIKKLVTSQLKKEILSVPHFSTLKNPISQMLNDHEEEGDRFGKISELTNGFVPPLDACNTFKVTYALIQEFENDLHKHIHLENNILFPRAIKLEEELKMTNYFVSCNEN